MYHRLFAILLVVCLAGAGTGCASIFHKPKTQKHKTPKHHTRKQSQEVLLPRQTGSNLNRRTTLDDESSLKIAPQPESKPLSKKRVKTARTEPEQVEPEKPKNPEKPVEAKPEQTKPEQTKPEQTKPEQTAPPPERFR